MLLASKLIATGYRNDPSPARVDVDSALRYTDNETRYVH
jgi:hypothetical protein